MTDFAFSAFDSGQFLSASDKPRKLSLGRRLALWIETSQQCKADQEIARVRARFEIKPEWQLSGR